MARAPKTPVEQIEETQEALRHSIEEARQLAERAQILVEKHKARNTTSSAL